MGSCRRGVRMTILPLPTRAARSSLPDAVALALKNGSLRFHVFGRLSPRQELPAAFSSSARSYRGGARPSLLRNSGWPFRHFSRRLQNSLFESAGKLRAATVFSILFRVRCLTTDGMQYA